jgi:hypothetical protein
MPIRGNLLALFLLGQTSCITVTSTAVRVRDLRQLDLQKQDSGEVVIPLGAGSATVPVEKGVFWNWFEKVPFEVDAIRGTTGALHLQCDACGAVPFPKRGRDSAPLVSADGTVMPSVGRARITTAAITLPYQICFVTSGRRHEYCEVESKTSVTIPWENVVAADRFTSPIRGWGIGLLALGAVEIASGAIILSPVFGDASFSTRAAFGVPLLTTGAVAAAFGLWHILAHPSEEHIYPLGPAKQ